MTCQLKFEYEHTIAFHFDLETILFVFVFDLPIESCQLEERDRDIQCDRRAQFLESNPTQPVKFFEKHWFRFERYGLVNILKSENKT